jgi:glutaminyl-peptide cyclotransferase
LLAKERIKVATQISRVGIAVLLVAAFFLAACGGKGTVATEAASEAAAAPVSPPEPQQAAPAPEKTGGFDGQKAFQHVADLVAIGPRSAGTDANHRAQDYLIGQLKAMGCPVDPEAFHTPTPLGDMEMRNIVVKIPGTSPDILLFLTHYDTKRLPNFVGADDSGSSTGVMLELARLLCPRKSALTMWIAFLDGEEAFNPTVWQDPDNTYGSRELAARMAVSGDLARTKAVILADMVGGRNLRLQKESDSTSWLKDMIWSTAAKLGYGDTFVSSSSEVTDDHDPFLARHVPAADIIDLSTPIQLGYWHMPEDTLDKVSPTSLAMVGHVLIAVVPQLEQKFARPSTAKP